MRSVLLFALAAVLIGCQDSQSGKASLGSRTDSISYAIGLDIGRDLKSQSYEVNPDIVAHAIKDVLLDREKAIAEDDAGAMMMSLHDEMMAKHTSNLRETAEKNKAAGEAFLVENAKKQGVKTLESGLQYKVIKMGSGKKPKSNQTVRVHYRGKLVDGTEFDSSHNRGQPVTFEVGNVIAGFSEALLLMPAGSKWEIYIPAKLAYGEAGAGAIIPPNSTLIFEIELLEVL
ncbi:MAG: FKBP-type peptidyl-prolyl cis-trans isomerase [Ignavibacteria bacterium]|nr:FKBP-type peptidyl-prolyl cis-trans isomerase [Ignavibacteria bacterium]